LKEQNTIETRFCVNGTGSKSDPKRSWRRWGHTKNRMVHVHMHHLFANT
jgi:hypothetical protein